MEHSPDTCDACVKNERDLSNLARANYPQSYEHQQFLLIMKEWYKTCPVWIARNNRPHHVGNGKHNGLWAGTLTMSTNDPYNESMMVDAIKKIMRQKTCPVKRYAWYLEYTEKETPHIHFIYETETGGRITAQTFKRRWPIWDETMAVGRGHRGGYHKPVTETNSYLEYIKKDNNIRHEDKWN